MQALDFVLFCSLSLSLTHTHTHTHTHLHKHTHTNKYTNTQNTYTNKHIQTNTQTNKHTHKQIHKQTHTHTHKHIIFITLKQWELTVGRHFNTPYLQNGTAWCVCVRVNNLRNSVHIHTCNCDFSDDVEA